MQTIIRIPAPILLAFAMVIAGCQSLTPAQSAGKTLATVATSVDVSMQAWADYVVWAEANPATERAELLRSEGKVKSAYERYQSAMRLASAAYAQAVTDPLPNTTALDHALAAVRATQGELLNLIQALKKR